MHASGETTPLAAANSSAASARFGSAKLHRHLSRRPTYLVLTALLTAMAVLSTGCISFAPKHNPNVINYLVNADLVTTNVATAQGYTNDAALLTDRLYPSAYINGPKGQLIPNPDFIDANLVSDGLNTAVYTISEAAQFSDGAEVTCDSFVLAFAASRIDAFHSFLPLMSQIEGVHCVPGTKTAEVVFREGFGDRWRSTFGAGSLLPVHAIARRLDVPLEEITHSLQDEQRNPELVAAVAELWNTGFNLDNFDAELQVSSGPYRISHVGEQGEVYLERNEHFAGSPAETAGVVVWPKDADVTALKEDQQIGLAELASMDDSAWINRDNSYSQYQIEPTPGLLAEQLVLSNRGLFADVELRQAFAACVDQRQVAEVSSKISGVQVEPTTVRTARLSDPFAARLAELTAEYMDINPEAAARLDGVEINIGYVAPNARYKAMVEVIRKTCAPFGVTINDVSTPEASITGLSRTDAAGIGPQATVGQVDVVAPAFDAFLATIDPDQAFPDSAFANTEIVQARQVELQSWETVSTIPLAAQPRIFVTRKDISNVAVNSAKAGVGWNMDRWKVVEDN